MRNNEHNEYTVKLHKKMNDIKGMLKIIKWGTTDCVRGVHTQKRGDLGLYNIKAESTKFSSIELCY